MRVGFWLVLIWKRDERREDRINSVFAIYMRMGGLELTISRPKNLATGPRELKSSSRFDVASSMVEGVIESNERSPNRIDVALDLFSLINKDGEGVRDSRVASKEASRVFAWSESSSEESEMRSGLTVLPLCS
jgi:hypothetical protein